ncbi:MAG: hypothetical protein M1828_002027 [Chrysothrix sp. TS-e1954]|nr:MAG: hypothetical protein M1828_002027 [Chrysothrix sp. TS-e1954]
MSNNLGLGYPIEQGEADRELDANAHEMLPRTVRSATGPSIGRTSGTNISQRRVSYSSPSPSSRHSQRAVDATSVGQTRPAPGTPANPAFSRPPKRRASPTSHIDGTIKRRRPNPVAADQETDLSEGDARKTFFKGQMSQPSASDPIWNATIEDDLLAAAHGNEDLSHTYSHCNESPALNSHARRSTSNHQWQAPASRPDVQEPNPNYHIRGPGSEGYTQTSVYGSSSRSFVPGVYDHLPASSHHFQNPSWQDGQPAAIDHPQVDMPSYPAQPGLPAVAVEGHTKVKGLDLTAEEKREIRWNETGLIMLTDKDLLWQTGHFNTAYDVSKPKDAMHDRQRDPGWLAGKARVTRTAVNKRVNAAIKNWLTADVFDRLPARDRREYIKDLVRTGSHGLDTYRPPPGDFVGHTRPYSLNDPSPDYVKRPKEYKTKQARVNARVPKRRHHMLDDSVVKVEDEEDEGQSIRTKRRKVMPPEAVAHSVSNTVPQSAQRYTSRRQPPRPIGSTSLAANHAPHLDPAGWSSLPQIPAFSNTDRLSAWNTPDDAGLTFSDNQGPGYQDFVPSLPHSAEHYSQGNPTPAMPSDWEYSSCAPMGGATAVNAATSQGQHVVPDSFNPPSPFHDTPSDDHIGYGLAPTTANRGYSTRGWDDYPDPSGENDYDNETVSYGHGGSSSSNVWRDSGDLNAALPTSDGVPEHTQSNFDYSFLNDAKIPPTGSGVANASHFTPSCAPPEGSIDPQLLDLSFESMLQSVTKEETERKEGGDANNKPSDLLDLKDHQGAP